MGGDTGSISNSSGRLKYVDNSSMGGRHWINITLTGSRIKSVAADVDGSFSGDISFGFSVRHFKKRVNLQQSASVHPDMEGGQPLTQSLLCGVTYLVSPGVAPTLQDLDRFRLLIRELLPTLGKPAECHSAKRSTIEVSRCV